MTPEEFVSLLTPEMYMRLRNIAGRFNHYWSEDIVQEAAISAWKNRDKFNGDCAFEGWVSRIVTNTANTFNRNLGTCRVYDYAHSIEDNSHSETPHNLLEAQRKLTGIIETLTAMKPTKRDAWMIYYTTPAEFKAMPAMIGGTVGSNKSRVSRANNELQELFNEDPRC